MAQYPLPSWIQPADEAGNLARGIGLGQGQAAQRLAEQQAQFQEQQAAVNQARADMEFKLRSEAQARKFAGQQKFQQLIAGGMDPATALLQVAPLVNESLTGAAQLYKATQPPPDKVFDVAGGLYRAGATGPAQKLVEPPSTVPHWVPPDPTTGAPGYFASPSGGVHIPTTPKAKSFGTRKVVNPETGETVTVPLTEEEAAQMGKGAAPSAQPEYVRDASGAFVLKGQQKAPPKSTVPIPSLMPVPQPAPIPDIPGLNPPSDSGPTMPSRAGEVGARESARKHDTEVAEAKQIYQRLKKRGQRGFQMGAGEYRKDYLRLADLLSRMEDDEQKSVTEQ